MMKEREDLDQDYVGTCFDRQVRIEQWDQKKLSQQSVLLLGVGGLGSIVMMNVLRLGVKRIFIVDRDVVDLHNLNRQLMYCRQDVGKPKVQCATKNAAFHNVGGTQIVGFHGDAIKNWQKIIDMAKQSDAVFNCIDYGEYFDIVVASLCINLKIPLIMGGTFQTSMTVDYFSGDAKPCYLCSDDTAKEKDVIERVTPTKVMDIEDLSFLPKNNNPIGRSSVIVCTLCGQLMVSHYLNYVCLAEVKPYPSSRTICYHNTLQLIKFDLEKEPKCMFCGDPNYVAPPKVEEVKQEKTKDQSVQTGQQPIVEEQKPEAKVEEVVSLEAPKEQARQPEKPQGEESK